MAFTTYLSKERDFSDFGIGSGWGISSLPELPPAGPTILLREAEAETILQLHVGKGS
jgi:hypothetical protein